MSAPSGSSPARTTGWEHDANESAYRAGAGYVVTHENGDEMELTLKRIAQNTFIAQTKGKEGDYLYGLLVFEGNTIYEYAVALMLRGFRKLPPRPRVRGARAAGGRR